MFTSLPTNAQEFMQWSWSQIEPYYHDLAHRTINQQNLTDWLKDWTRLYWLLHEMQQRLYVATTVDTTDQQAKQRYERFLDEIYPAAQAADQKLKEKLLSSGIQPPGFEIPLRNLRTQADLFREDNLPLLSEEMKWSTQYDQIIGAQTVEWEGKEVTLLQLQPVYQDPHRERRERAWCLASKRQLSDRQAINELWGKFMALRGQLARNAALSDYRSYRWRQLLRLDYSPEDCYRFHRAIERVVVPLALRLYEKRRRRLGVKTLRPWDLEVDSFGRPPLRPFREASELESKTAIIFHNVDAKLGEYFDIMRHERLLDLENRKGKAPGAYCIDFQVAKRPFIFMNAVGIHDDVLTLLHEGGHAFHVFETTHLPYHQQLEVPLEFAEVASTSMEYLGAPYLSAEQDGFYSINEAARARVEHLERALLFWPYMAVVDAFQHWVYENHAAASDPANCDAQWSALWQRFMPGVDWSGLEDEMATGWQRKLHIIQAPFYYIEYGLSQLGAVLIWRNALKNRARAVADYRKALSLGSTVNLPTLFATAGAKFSFDEETLSEAVSLMASTIEELETGVLSA